MSFSNPEKQAILFDEQLEQQLLGSILIENRVLQNIELDLQETTFYYEENKKVFEAIKNLLQTNKTADEKTLFYTLADSDFSHTGDDLKNFISNLIDAGASLMTTPKEAVKILNHLALKRELLGLNQEINDIVNGGANTFNIDEKIGEVEQKIYKITNNKTAKDNNTQLGRYTAVLKEKLKKARESNKDIQGVRTGLKDLDTYTGGLQKSDLIIIAARPSMGKTALATTIAKNVAEILQKEAKTPEEMGGIAVFSLEMSGEQLASRIIAMDSGFNTKTIHTARIDDKDLITGEVIEKNKKISDKQWNEIVESIENVSKLPLFIDDTPALPITLLRSRARYLKSRYNICAIIIDYLQLLRASKNFGGNRVLEIAEITSTLKAIAKELDIPVVALSQLSRAVEGADRKDKRPQLSDLRESGTIEQDADIVMLLYREEYYEARKEPRITEDSDDMEKEAHSKWLSKYEKIKDLADIIIAKNRNGPVGTITLHFDREHMVFSSYNPNGDPYNYAGHTPLPKGQNNMQAIQQPKQEYIENENIPQLQSPMEDDNLELDEDLMNVFK